MHTLQVLRNPAVKRHTCLITPINLSLEAAGLYLQRTFLVMGMLQAQWE